jgi:nicotinate-nucleotide pyrophosphorylase (carboxylating)
MEHLDFIKAALKEDLGGGDFSTLSCIPPSATGKAILKVKENGIIAGINLARDIFKYLEPETEFVQFRKDGDRVLFGEIAFEVQASVSTILSAERLALNCMQRMSGIATLTSTFVDKIKHTSAKILDTRKTTPLFRRYEKEAVLLGGGANHRMGLYDMILLKDNHIDFCGGITAAITETAGYIKANNLNLKIEVETRSLKDVEAVLSIGLVDRIMLDNFEPALVAEAVKMIAKKYETEASGGINIGNVAAYAETGVDFISVGAIIHHAVSMDLSLKAQIM